MASGLAGSAMQFADCTKTAFMDTFWYKLGDWMRAAMAYWVFYEPMTLHGVLCSVQYMGVTLFLMNWLTCFHDLVKGGWSAVKTGFGA